MLLQHCGALLATYVQKHTKYAHKTCFSLSAPRHTHQLSRFHAQAHPAYQLTYSLCNTGMTTNRVCVRSSPCLLPSLQLCSLATTASRALALSHHQHHHHHHLFLSLAHDSLSRCSAARRLKTNLKNKTFLLSFCFGFLRCAVRCGCFVVSSPIHIVALTSCTSFLSVVSRVAFKYL